MGKYHLEHTKIVHTIPFDGRTQTLQLSLQSEGVQDRLIITKAGGKRLGDALTIPLQCSAHRLPN